MSAESATLRLRAGRGGAVVVGGGMAMKTDTRFVDESAPSSGLETSVERRDEEKFLLNTYDREGSISGKMIMFGKTYVPYFAEK